MQATPEHSDNLNQDPKPIALLDMEEKLWADSDGSHRAWLDSLLAALEEKVRTALRELRPPTEHQQCLLLADGVASARRVLADCCKKPK